MLYFVFGLSSRLVNPCLFHPTLCLFGACHLVFSLAEQTQPLFSPCNIILSQTWYAVLDNSVNYCNLHNLVSQFTRDFPLYYIFEYLLPVFANEVWFRRFYSRWKWGRPSHLFVFDGRRLVAHFEPRQFGTYWYLRTEYMRKCVRNIS